MARETKLGNPALEKAVAETGDADLKQALRLVAGRQQGDRRHGPRRAAVSVRARSAWSDSPSGPTCSSARRRRTRRSKRNGKSTTSPGSCVAICGQEIGSKKESLAVAKQYPPNHTLMIGDAPGDYKAAVGEQLLVLPDQPGRRRSQLAAAARRRHRPRFFEGTFAGAYQQQLLDEFDTFLPERPPWPVED